MGRFSDNSMKEASFEEPKLEQWTNLPFASDAVNNLKAKLLAWSVVLIILHQPDIAITNLVFVRFEEPLTDSLAALYLGPVVVYYAIYWAIRHVEYLRQRANLKPFFIIEELKPAIEDITRANERGPSKVNNFQDLSKFIKRYNECEESIPKIITTRYVVYALFDVLVPTIVGGWALTLYVKSLFS